MSDMEKPATDIYTFKKLREGGYTYVDKTDVILPLVDNSIGKQFFIARPRRFGKSLLVSTLQCLFEGRRELFEGLKIEPKWDWSKQWPVLHLDMGDCQAATVEEFWSKVETLLAKEAERLGVPLRSGETPSGKFMFLISDLAAKSKDGQMVLLVDEYDKPLLGHLAKPDVTAFRDALKSFYSTIKTSEGLQRFTFLTGVSKFSKVSVFSDLNNLKDRTMSPKEAMLLGYTHEEVKKYYPNMIRALGEKYGVDEKRAFEIIVSMYDGYRFEENAEQVINPVSLGLCLEQQKFGNYWSQTAIPTFLIDILRRRPLLLKTIDLAQSALDAYEPERPTIETLLYQTGYLTIKSSRIVGRDMTRTPPELGQTVYELGFPNKEVSDSFTENLVPAYVGLEKVDANNLQRMAGEALLANDVPRFLKAMDGFFRSIPYSLTDRQNEQMWQTIVWTVLKSVGVYANGEVQTADGRVDMTVETPTDVYLIEFKLDDTAANAIAQIREKDYAAPFAFSQKRITLIGLGFSSEQRTVTDSAAEPF